MQKKQRLAAEVAAESGVDIVFLDIDGVLLPFEPSEQYSTDEDAVTCWECSDQEKEDRATWQCDVCSRCFCSACRAVEICTKCRLQICSFCADEGECESCRLATSAGAANPGVPAGDTARGPSSSAQYSRDVSEGLADHFNFQPPASGAAVSTNVAGPEDDGCSMFHKECMDNLVHILEQTGARIVLSSTWRKRQEWHQGIGFAKAYTYARDTTTWLEQGAMNHTEFETSSRNVADILGAFRHYLKKHVNQAGAAGPVHHVLPLDSFDYMTPILPSNCRGEEIAAWLPARNLAGRDGDDLATNGIPMSLSVRKIKVKIRSWVALDDEDLIEGPDNIKYSSVFRGRYVKIDPAVGLTADNAREAIAILQRGRDLACGEPVGTLERVSAWPR